MIEINPPRSSRHAEHQPHQSHRQHLNGYARTAVAGTKGAVDEFILTLASAGVFSTSLDVLRAWLGRDKTRSVELSYQDADGEDQHLSVTATNATAEALEPVLAAVASRIATEP